MQNKLSSLAPPESASGAGATALLGNCLLNISYRPPTKPVSHLNPSWTVLCQQRWLTGTFLLVPARVLLNLCPHNMIVSIKHETAKTRNRVLGYAEPYSMRVEWG